MKPRIQKVMPQHAPKKREGMDTKHLENVRHLPCLACGFDLPAMEIIEAHHLLRTGEHGMGRKSSDRWAVPLSAGCHKELHEHGGEEVWFAARNIDARAIARALWANRGNLEAMKRVIFRARQAARLATPNAPAGRE